MIEQPDFISPASTSVRTARDRIIVSCGIGAHYRARLRSTVNHCAVHCPDTWRLFYDDYPIGCPPHHEQQYAFKIYALQRAIAAGFRYVLWMDTSFQPIASIEPLWKIIEEQGWFVARQGDARIGTWISDNALGYFGGGRDSLMETPLCYSGLVGLDLKNQTGFDIWNRWTASYAIGAWNGPHFNTKQRAMHLNGLKYHGLCSDDPRCEGHRHDEASLSMILYLLGLTPMTTGLLTLESERGIIGHCVPDYDVVKLRQEALNQIRQDWSRATDAENEADEKRILELCR